VAPLSLGAGNVAVLLALMCLPVVTGNCAFDFITLLQFPMGYCAGFVTTTQCLSTVLAVTPVLTLAFKPLTLELLPTGQKLDQPGRLL
jgi:hypothetical protein